MPFKKKLTVRSPADLVAAVPYLIGFHPGDGSIVVIACRDSRITFAARNDLPAPDASADRLGDILDNLLPIVRRQQPITAVMIIAYGEADHVDPALRAFGEAFTADGTPVQELVRVTGSRLFNLLCKNPDCCPPQGTPFDPTTSLVTVESVAAGLVALPDRAAVAARIAPNDGAARDSMHRATTRAARRLTAVRATGGAAVDEAGAHTVRDALRQYEAGRRLTDDEVAWLTHLLTRDSVRDVAVDLTEPDERHVEFWADITRRAHEPLVAAPATLLALAAWRCGNGVLATMAVERALQVDPAYRLADLLLQALYAGVPPSAVAQASTLDAHRRGHPRP